MIISVGTLSFPGVSPRSTWFRGEVRVKVRFRHSFCEVKGQGLGLSLGLGIVFVRSGFRRHLGDTPKEEGVPISVGGSSNDFV